MPDVLDTHSLFRTDVATLTLTGSDGRPKATVTVTPDPSRATQAVPLNLENRWAKLKIRRKQRKPPKPKSGPLLEWLTRQPTRIGSH